MHRFHFLVTAVLFPLAQLSAVTVETAYSQYFNEEEIRPVSQYFGASLTKQRFRTVVASDPSHPAGHYFVAKLEDADGATISSARMTYFLSDRKDPASHTWDVSAITLKDWLYLGLTGNDWPAGEVQPMAWRLELLDADGTVIAEWKSFLWEMS